VPKKLLTRKPHFVLRTASLPRRAKLKRSARQSQCFLTGFYGILGDISRFVAEQSESGPAAILSQLVVTYGNCIGRTPFFQIEATKHHTNLFAVMVGAAQERGRGLPLITPRRFSAKPIATTCRRL
jgi:hypothetical protein